MRLCDTWIEEWNCGVELLEVYVVDENILQCICALAWVCDAWNGKWNCDIWLLLYMEGIYASMIDGIELRGWLYDIVMYCERKGW